jgi:hypothetical protein
LGFIQYPHYSNIKYKSIIFFHFDFSGWLKAAIEGTNETFQAPKVIQKIRLGGVEMDVQNQHVLHCICYKMIVHPTFQEGAQPHDG